MQVARTIARRSLCSRDQVGAVIVSKDNRIVDTGYNGPPRHHWPSRNGTPCSQWCKRYSAHAAVERSLTTIDPTYSDCDSLHAEQNALMFSDRRLREGGKIYVSSSVCGTCAKLIANSGLVEVVYARTEGGVALNSDKWVAFMEHCGLTVVEYELI